MLLTVLGKLTPPHSLPPTWQIIKHPQGGGENGEYNLFGVQDQRHWGRFNFLMYGKWGWVGKLMYGKGVKRGGGLGVNIIQKYTFECGARPAGSAS